MKPLGTDDPRQIGDYRILRVLGAGGMGRVYLGRSVGGRVVAVKVVRPELADDPGFRTRFKREVDAARRVGGVWTAPVIDADTDAETPWLVTGYVPGPSLYEAVESRGPLPEQAVRTLGSGLAEALQAVHAAGLIHRDLKPSNVLLSLDGPKVIDFGISRAFDASVLTRTGFTVGSPGFMSPEQVDGRDVGPASDVFSLGSVLVFASTGTGAFGAGSGQALMFRIVANDPQLDSVPAGLRSIVAACLQKHAASRPTPAEVTQALEPSGTQVAVALADSTAGGWLPPDLNHSLSRRAVSLLELEADPVAEPESTVMNRGPFDLEEINDAPPTHTPLPDRRARWPWLAALAVVAIVAGVVVALNLMDDTDKKKNNNSASGVSPTASSPLKSPATTPAPVTGSGSMPADYIGKWTGTSTSGQGLTASVTVDLKKGDVGDVVGKSSTTTSALGSDVTCSGDVKLISATPDGVLVQDIPGSGEAPTILGLPACSAGGQIRLKLQTDGTLEYQVKAAGTGDPKGMLTKS